MTVIHVCDGWAPTNGAAVVARFLADEQRVDGARVLLRRWVSPRELRAADEVWIHCGWMPCLWWAALWAKAPVWVPAGCYDPVRLRFHGWKKRLAGPVERFCLRRCVRIVTTCASESEWVKAYLGRRCPPVEVSEIRRFFLRVSPLKAPRPLRGGVLRVLYMGRAHPLKGLEFLERAVAELNADLRGSARVGLSRVELKIVSNAFGDEKDRAFAECDVFCLPTVSDNLGLVVAEALAHGKPVITTDGAPAWSAEPREEADGRPRLVYLEGYRAGSETMRVELLKGALVRFANLPVPASVAAAT